MLSVDSGTRVVSSDFSDSCQAVRLGFQLLNCVESEDDTKSKQVKGDGESERTNLDNTDNNRMENSQHSPPMYPNNQADPAAASQQQQPKVQQQPQQQMTDLSNCTAVHNSSNSINNNNNNANTTNNMTNPLRLKHFAEQSDRELAELATQEISLDLQGLIDETHFPDDNLFGDLMDTAKKNEAMYGAMMGRGSGSGTPGSSGQNSPGSEGQNSPPAYNHNNHNPHYRNTLAYLPGSVHHGANYNQHHHHHPQVKQEPVDHEFNNSQAPSSTTTSSHYNSSNNSYSNNTVSSSTHHNSEQQMSPVLPFGLGGPLPSLKSFAQQPKYAIGSSKKKQSPNEKGSDEYRRRRERNNVAVRKSREKAKMRTRETEDRVKILARENERLQKKVELLQEELSVLRSLFSSVGVLPDHIHRELAKHLDNFQAQHAAINY